MTVQPRRMKLGAFLHPTGHHVAAWRHPRAQADGGVNFPHYAELARTAERGRFDMLFLADSAAVWDAGALPNNAPQTAFCRAAEASAQNVGLMPSS
jgi:alkanesulfonate monooxygenase SsuD/methylene tetrahydromethanopterin reductase-like flavin-dependent oxidoreductase (luciferase family)